jgi:hypothetical protein
VAIVSLISNNGSHSLSVSLREAKRLLGFVAHGAELAASNDGDALRRLRGSD